MVACLTNAFWAKVCAAIERPECADDPRYGSIQQRRDHRDEVNALVSDYTARHSVADLVTRFAAHEVPHAPILGVGEALAQEQTVARGMVVEVEHATLGPIPIVNRPFHYVDAKQAPPAAPPVLGQHTDAVLGEVLGLDAVAIANLRASGSIG